MNDVPPDERLPDLDEVRVPAGCQIDCYGGMPRRMCVESYDDVMAKMKETHGEEDALLEFRVLSGPPTKAEIVRWTCERRVIGPVLEITAALEDRWKAQEEEREQALGGGAGFMIPLGLGGPGGFQIG